MPKAVYICDPGAPRDLTPEQMAEKCKCGHERGVHWWGDGPCECGGRIDGRGCDYFRPRAASQETAPKGGPKDAH